jgi:Bacterial Ig domain/Lysyl oxidase
MNRIILTAFACFTFVMTSLVGSSPVFGAVAIDANVSGNQGTASTTVSTSSFSTTSANELLLAFVSADQVLSSKATVTGIGGGGLTWVLVERTNAQKGTAEIWRAFASSTLSGVTVTATLSQTVCSSITVVSFSGVDTSGTNGSGAIGAIGTRNANPGLPTANLVTTRNSSLVLGVGNDWDNPIARTVGAGQTLVHQYLAPVGDTYWVQTESSPTLLSGTTVTINDTAPPGDRYNLSIVEVLALLGGGTTGTITGSITPIGSANGAVVTLSQNGTPVTSLTVGSSGTFQFNNVANGTYTVNVSEAGFTYNPPTQSATVSGNTVSLPAFTATSTTGTISGSITPASSANGAVVTLSQNGTPVSSFTVGSTGTFSFTGVPNGTYVVTPAEAGFTFSPTAQSATVNGNTVTIPVFTALGSTGTINGSITPTANANGVAVQLMQGPTVISSTVVGVSGSFTFASVPNGIYSLVPSETGFTFNPTSESVTVSGTTVTAPPISATGLSGTISGTISQPSSPASAIVQLFQGTTLIATTNPQSTGTYTFPNILNGTYTLVPSETRFTFNPASQTVTVSGVPLTVPVFTAAPQTWTITGTITPQASGGGTSVALTQNSTPVGTAIADATGTYTFSGISNGTYTATPTKAGFAFTPPNQSVTVSDGNATVPTFAAQSSGPPLLYPDLQDILPPGMMSVVQTSNGKQFQYTHDTLNAGPGPLVIQPVFNAASGTYQGTQFIYTLSASGVWSINQRLPIAGAFIFDSDHGHFHFPFVTYGLYTVGSDGKPGTPVAVSAKVSFCINDSFIYLPNIPNAGELGNLGSCSDPTSLRGLNIGAVDEYDQTDAGQSISIDTLPDGTYWLRAIDDPNNFLFESDKTNNETDVEITITGTTLKVLQTVIPVINNPPTITLASPLNGATISRTVQLTASTATTSGVQYLIDGQSFGSIATAAPYSVSWDTTTVPDGTHWLAAQTTDSTGVIGTSLVAIVTVNNAANIGPTAQLTSPSNGSIVSATISMYAQVGSSLPIQSVVFFVDFAQIGASIAAPPYIISWDTTTVPDGQHTITVSATDSQGNVGNSSPVTLNVNNSHPANLIGKEVTVSVDGHDAITTPVFSTVSPSDLLVAFVSYDGPSNGPQTATVTGAGLTWTLLERSNTQSGTAEIWSSRADGTLSGVTVTAQQQAVTGLHGSLTVIAFTNAAGTSVVGRTGAATGAPDIPLPGVIAGDWVFAVGNDWDRAVARVAVSGQVLVHQKVDTAVGDTYWVQSTTAPSPANALVDIHDTTPTNDRWNYAAVEIVATHQ